MGQACSTDDDKPFVPKPPSPLRVRVATPPPPLVSGSPIENALKRTEAAEREQFKMAKRRDLWASAREGAGPSLPTLNGLWHVERPQPEHAAPAAAAAAASEGERVLARRERVLDAVNLKRERPRAVAAAAAAGSSCELGAVGRNVESILEALDVG